MWVCSCMRRLCMHSCATTIRGTLWACPGVTTSAADVSTSMTSPSGKEFDLALYVWHLSQTEVLTTLDAAAVSLGWISTCTKITSCSSLTAYSLYCVKFLWQLDREEIVFTGWHSRQVPIMLHYGLFMGSWMAPWWWLTLSEDLPLLYIYAYLIYRWQAAGFCGVWYPPTDKNVTSTKAEEDVVG